MLAPALGLHLVTPPSFLRAISEGSDVSAADKRTIDRQIASRQIAIYVYNSQNATPDVQAQLASAGRTASRSRPSPRRWRRRATTYQQWQSDAARRDRAGSGEGGSSDDRTRAQP